MCSRKHPNPKKQLTDAVKAVKQAKPSKYKNKWVIRDGIKFQSIREADRWDVLNALLGAGKITNLRRQVKYKYVLTAYACPDMLSGQKALSVFVYAGRPRWYAADFVYYDTATQEVVVEDAKGVRTKEYKAKKKIVEALYGITIVEV